MISDRMFSSRRRVTWLGGVAALATAFALGCSDTTQPKVKPTPAGMGRLAVYAVTPTSSGITGLSLTVSGPGIVKADGTADTLVFNLTMSNGTATGSITIPSGPARVITGHAFAGATETHRGSVTMDIVQGTNPTVTITLVPFVGDVPITINVGTSLVIVTPDSVEAAIGDTLRFKAKVLDNTGNAISGVVRWASVDPARVTIDTLGLATVRDTGKAHIVATYGTVGGYAEIHATKASTVSYHLTWNGSVSTNWTDTANWTPHGTATVSRVPTAADSVVIPSSPTNQPMINACSDAQVMDLVVQAGAQLSAGCYGYGVKVVRSAVSQGKINVPIRLQKGATIGGLFNDVYVEGDSVTLTDTVSSRSLQITAAQSRLLLGGHNLNVGGDLAVSHTSSVTLGGARVYVTGNATLNDSSWIVMRSAKDTLNVRGSLTLGIHDSRADSSFLAGVLRLGGSMTAGNRFDFAPMDSFYTIIDGPATAYQYLSADSASLNLGNWPNVDVRGNGNVIFGYYSSGSDSLNFPRFTVDSSPNLQFYNRRISVSPVSGALTVNNRLQATYGTLYLNGRLVLPDKVPPAVGSPQPAIPTLSGYGAIIVRDSLYVGAGDSVTVDSLQLNHASSMKGVSATSVFKPRMAVVTGVQPTIVPGLPYQGLTIVGATTGTTLTGATTFTGNVVLTKNSRLVLGGQTMYVGGTFTSKDTSWFEMTNASDVLNVRGTLDVQSVKDTRGLLTSGVLHVGGYFYTNAKIATSSSGASGLNSFAPSGSFQTIFDGTSYQYVYVDSAALNSGVWPYVIASGTGSVNFTYRNNAGTISVSKFRIDSAAAVSFNYSKYIVTPDSAALNVRKELATYGTVTVNGKLALTTGASVSGALAPTPKLDGWGTLVVADTMSVASGDSVTMTGTLQIDNNGGTGFVNSSAYFSPSTLVLTSANPNLKAGLRYQNVTVNGGAITLGGHTETTGALALNSQANITLNSVGLVVGGDLTLNDTSYVSMLKPLDTLSVRGNFYVKTQKDTRSLLTNGVLVLGGNLNTYAKASTTSTTGSNLYSFAPSGSHKTIFNGTGYQYAYVDSAALYNGNWPNVHIAGKTGNTVYFGGYNSSADSIKITNFSIDTSASATFGYYKRVWAVIADSARSSRVTVPNRLQIDGTVDLTGGLTVPNKGVAGATLPVTPVVVGGGTLALSDSLSVGTNDSVTVATLRLTHLSGTTGVADSTTGTRFSPSTLELAGVRQNLRDSLQYKGLLVSGTFSFPAGSFHFDGDGTVSSTGSMTVPSGTTVSFCTNHYLTIKSGGTISNGGIIKSTYTSPNPFTGYSGTGTLSTGTTACP
ncbi:MAG TPA: Ig-like domain-containing protein [Gemmatimonadaceae bacterium]